MSIPRRLTIVLLGAALLAVPACDATDATRGVSSGESPASGRCLPDVAGCVDTPGDNTEPAIDDEDRMRDDARGLLGTYERDLPAEVRIARRGEDLFALTEDYVIGRRTVELDDTDGDGFRVVEVTVELPGGPATFELQGG